MIGKTQEIVCDVYPDIEIDPQKFTKRIRAHSKLLTFLIEISLLVIGSILLPILLNSPKRLVVSGILSNILMCAQKSLMLNLPAQKNY